MIPSHMLLNHPYQSSTFCYRFQFFISLVTIVTPLEWRDPFHVRVAIPKEGKMGRNLGNSLPMASGHAEKKVKL